MEGEAVEGDDASDCDSCDASDCDSCDASDCDSCDALCVSSWQSFSKVSVYHILKKSGKKYVGPAGRHSQKSVFTTFSKLNALVH